jgi:hypothetical protein
VDVDIAQWLEELKARVRASGSIQRPPRANSDSPPCDFCHRAPRCAAEQLACTAFERFEAGLRWQIAPRVDATRERYERIFRKK